VKSKLFKENTDAKIRQTPRICAVLVLIFVLLLFPISKTGAKDLTLGWDLDRKVDGYKIYYKPGDGAGRKLENYNGKDAAEGDSPINVPIYRNENLEDPAAFEFTLHGLADNKKYAFVVTAYNDNGLESSGSREVQVLDPGDIPAPYNKEYTRGWRITAGDLVGFTVYYHDSNGVVPTLGPTDGIPDIRQTIADVQGVGAPLNLQPSGTHFSPSVLLFIPCAGYSDASMLDVYYYDDDREEWFLAHDADDDPDVVQPDAVGWLVAGSRLNHNETYPTTIEIQVYHFSGVQAGTFASASGGSGSVAPAGGGGGCFITALQK
jgi:hypothetical protein